MFVNVSKDRYPEHQSIPDVAQSPVTKAFAQLLQIQTNRQNWHTLCVKNTLWIGLFYRFADTSDAPVDSARRLLDKQERRGYIPRYRPSDIPTVSRARGFTIGERHARRACNRILQLQPIH